MPIGSLRPIASLIGLLLTAGAGTSNAQTEGKPLHQIIDQAITSGAEGFELAPESGDAEFFRRVHLDFAGVIPTVEATRAFIADSDPDKRDRVIVELLNAPEYATRMAQWFDVHLMERRGQDAHWLAWLNAAFAENRPWDTMARQLIRADFRDEANRGAAFFYTKRLEKVGQQPTDYPGLTRDMGRLFLGMDLQCAECHNHRLVDEYDQIDFQGLFAAFSNVKRLNRDYPAIEEGLMSEELEYASVFTGRKRTTGPRVPGFEAVEIPVFAKGDEYEVAPDKKAKTPGVPKFSALEAFAEQIPQSPNFARNIVNRLWFMMMGRGLYEPLDLYHTENPPSHPELLEHLAQDLRANGYDLRRFLGEIARSQCYQRTSRLPDGANEAEFPLDRFLVARQRRLSAEQLLASTVRACGLEPGEGRVGRKAPDAEFDGDAEPLQDRFREALGNAPKIPEHAFAPSLKGALFMMNDAEVQALITEGARAFNHRAEASAHTPAQIAEALYLQVLSRPPSSQEAELVAEVLRDWDEGGQETALRSLLWAMLTSTEFVVNH